MASRALATSSRFEARYQIPIDLRHSWEDLFRLKLCDCGKLCVSFAASYQVDKAEHRRSPLTRMFKEHPKAALRVIGIVMAGNLLNHLWLVHFPT